MSRKDRLNLRPDFDSAEALLADLKWLCSLPTTTGQPDQLHAAARAIGDWLWRLGFSVESVPTPTAPILIAVREGRSPQRVLLYHHYDVTPPGPWRAWSHSPLELAEREGAIYGRGVAHGKGPLAAQLHALQALIRSEQELPVGVVLVLEGSAMQGSPALAETLAAHAELVQADLCLSTAGERDGRGLPFCYMGSKGLLQVALQVQGAALPLEPGLAASVANPVWRLIWALGNIKGDDEDIRVEGFYDAIAGPRNTDRDMLRAATVNEAARRTAWQIDDFLFHMRGGALIRSQTTLPTCNISAFVVESGSVGASIPTGASAQLDLQLVPDQTPDLVFAQIQKHLHDKNLRDVRLTKLPGAYAPITSDPAHPLIQHILAAGEQLYHAPLSVLPFGPFAQPLAIFGRLLNAPVAAVALAREDSAIYAANEHIPITDLLNHSRLLADFLLLRERATASVAA